MVANSSRLKSLDKAIKERIKSIVGQDLTDLSPIVSLVKNELLKEIQTLQQNQAKSEIVVKNQNSGNVLPTLLNLSKWFIILIIFMLFIYYIAIPLGGIFT